MARMKTISRTRKRKACDLQRPYASLESADEFLCACFCVASSLQELLARSEVQQVRTSNASWPVLYRSNSTGGAMPGLGTQPRRLAPAQHFLDTGPRRQGSFFVAAYEKFRALRMPYRISLSQTVINTSSLT
jgi:hypothetical protein